MNASAHRSATVLPHVTAAIVITAALLVLGACIDSPLLAPDGSSIDLSISPGQIVSEGDSATVTAFVTESDGRVVEDKTEVSFLATSGSLCDPRVPQPTSPGCGADVSASALTARTRDGIATAVFRSGVVPGSVTITARSGSVTKTATVSVSARVAAPNAKFVLQSEHDTVSVGQASTIIAFLATPDGPVPDGTRVVFSAADSAVVRQIVATQSGFAQTTVIGKKAGALMLHAVSGTVRDSLIIQVK